MLYRGDMPTQAKQPVVREALGFELEAEILNNQWSHIGCAARPACADWQQEGAWCGNAEPVKAY